MSFTGHIKVNNKVIQRSSWYFKLKSQKIGWLDKTEGPLFWLDSLESVDSINPRCSGWTIRSFKSTFRPGTTESYVVRAKHRYKKITHSHKEATHFPGDLNTLVFLHLQYK